MKRKSLLLVSFLLMLYMCPMIFSPSYASVPILAEPNMDKDFALSADSWLMGWTYRQVVNVDHQGGVGNPAGTDYQIFLNVTYNAHMQTDFDDVRFTDDDQTTLIDHWLQNKTDSAFALFWVEVADYIDGDMFFYMYYGNSTVTSTSSGDNTFQAFFNKTDITGWSLSDIAVSTSGDYLRFYNPVNTDVGMASRYDITTSADFQMMTQLKTVSLGAKDQFIISPNDGSSSHRFAMSIHPKDSAQTSWYYYDGGMKYGGGWTEGTEFIYTIQIDEGDSTTGIDYRRYDQAWALIDSVLNENFALGSPSDCDGLFLGDAGSDAYVDVYIRWMAFRKVIATGQPAFDSFGSEEEYIPSSWSVIEAITIIFYVPFDYWAFNMGLLFGGLALVVVSTCVLAAWIRNKTIDTDKGFMFLLIFMFGWGLFLGGALLG